MTKKLSQLYLFLYVAPIIAVLSGCNFYRMPSAKELAAVKEGKEAIILLRVTCDVNGTPYEAFTRFATADDNIALTIGSFDTGGVPKQQILWFLSEQTKKDGWTYFLLEPGVYYLAAQPPRRTNVTNYATQFLDAAKLRVDVPSNVGIVYIGTVHFPAEELKFLFEQSGIGPFIEDKITVVNDADAAGTIASEFFPKLGVPQVSLMQRHTGPIILRTPPSRK